jgi:hypothetical protein
VRAPWKTFWASKPESPELIPGVDLAKAICGKVTYSDTIKGYTVFMAPIPGPQRDLPGFHVYESLGFNYD